MYVRLQTFLNWKTYLKESTNFKIGTLALIRVTRLRKPSTKHDSILTQL